MFETLQSAVRLSILAAGLMAIGSLPALAMGGGSHGGGQHMKGVTGSGTGTGSINCAGSNCTETTSGKFRGTGMGNGSFSATLNFSNLNPIDNGSGGSCYGATGSITLTAANGDTVSLGDAGLFCETGSGSAPTTHNGSYIIQAGTGRFADSDGAGTVAVATDGSGTVYLNVVGAMMSGGGHMGGGGM